MLLSEAERADAVAEALEIALDGRDEQKDDGENDDVDDTFALLKLQKDLMEAQNLVMHAQDDPDDKAALLWAEEEVARATEALHTYEKSREARQRRMQNNEQNSKNNNGNRQPYKHGALAIPRGRVAAVCRNATALMRDAAMTHPAVSYTHLTLPTKA